MKKLSLGTHTLIYSLLFGMFASIQTIIVIKPTMTYQMFAYIGAFATGFLWVFIYILLSETLLKRIFTNRTINWAIPLVVSLGVIWLIADISSLLISRTHLNTFFISAILEGSFRESSGINDSTYYSAILLLTLMPIVTFVIIRYLKLHSKQFKINLKIFVVFFLITVVSERLIFSYGKFYQVGFIQTIEEAINWRPQSSFSSLFKQFNVYIPPQEITTNENSSKYIQQDKPHIILIMSESLRADMMEKEIMPNLNQIEGTQFKNNYSTSNGTHFGLISLLYGIFPTYYTSIIDNSVQSPLFDLTRQGGYKTHAVSSYHFNWFEMEKVIHKGLFDSFVLYKNSKVPWEKRDMMVKDYFIKNFKNVKTPQFYYLTFNSTHHNYSYPNNDKFNKFTPVIPENKNLFTISSSESRKILNRYKNSAYYVDSLVGEIVEHLKKEKQWSNTLLIFFGDHGEEFFEDGHTLHANTMNIYQNSAALFIHKPDDKKNLVSNKFTSHIDVLPTLWDILSVKPKVPWFKGSNLFSNESTSAFTTQIRREHPTDYGVVNEQGLCRLIKKDIDISTSSDSCKKSSADNMKAFLNIAK